MALLRSLEKSDIPLNETILLTDVVDLIPCGISFTMDMSCRKIHHNKTAANFLRIASEELPSKAKLKSPSVKYFRDGKELIPEEMPIQRSVWQGEEIIGDVLECGWSDGVKRTAVWNSSPLRSKTSGAIIGAIASSQTVNDTPEKEMTMRVNYEKELIRLERFNLLGQMAAGIAHEVRNPITTVRGFLQLLGSKQEYFKDKPFFDLMIEELDRSNEIMTEFLSLAKNKIHSEASFVKTNLNSLIFNLFPLLMSDAINLNQNIVFEDGEIEDLYLNTKEISQLVLNLIRNGFEANPPDKCVFIKTYLQDDSMVLSVRDQGPGIKPEILSKLGTPFLTTKTTGTGLGLSVCYNIAAKHDAGIKVETGPTGTKFIIKFKRLKLSIIENVSS